MKIINKFFISILNIFFTNSYLRLYIFFALHIFSIPMINIFWDV